MSNEYTQGRITVKAWRDACDLERADGEAIAIGPSPADARRLAACWNAFDTIDTTSIEELSNIGGVHSVTVVANKNLDQLDAARALLTELAALDESDGVFNYHGTTGKFDNLVERIADFLRGQP